MSNQYMWFKDYVADNDELLENRQGDLTSISHLVMMTWTTHSYLIVENYFY